MTQSEITRSEITRNEITRSEQRMHARSPAAYREARDRLVALRDRPDDANTDFFGQMLAKPLTGQQTGSMP